MAQFISNMAESSHQADSDLERLLSEEENYGTTTAEDTATNQTNNETFESPQQRPRVSIKRLHALILHFWLSKWAYLKTVPHPDSLHLAFERLEDISEHIGDASHFLQGPCLTRVHTSPSGYHYGQHPVRLHGQVGDHCESLSLNLSGDGVRVYHSRGCSYNPCLPCRDQEHSWSLPDSHLESIDGLLPRRTIRRAACGPRRW